MSETNAPSRPSELPETFLLGATAEITKNGVRGIDFTDEGRNTKDIVYVMALEDGRVIRVGETKGSLAARWSRPLGWLDVESESAPGRPNEANDMSRLRNALDGSVLAIWVKEAEKHSISYLGSDESVSLRHSEEVYLDRVLQPVVGRPLSPREQSR
ncbi:hypothetical protein VQ042_12915 [Aurantimonas sp. A2-1-M11]|uniref:hypothetical protein n=1 Tax=Aurantimonas sp. A2-1-M11 TaxID=3113712 RepID=UPI002F940844